MPIVPAAISVCISDSDDLLALCTTSVSSAAWKQGTADVSCACDEDYWTLQFALLAW